ncbi:hypothetical protein HYT45_02250 [Candidatus Uhrbacteria bacterium]|nr:hypothetical protein [Candidatus Uhrbacteria bacterium]
MNNEPTTNEVLEAINTLSTHIDERFTRVENDITGIKGDITGIKGDITGIKGEIIEIKATMVTKDYLDDKLADLRGDLVVLMRKEDKKVQSLVELLHSKKVISEEEAKRILSMDLFPQVSLR